MTEEIGSTSSGLPFLDFTPGISHDERAHLISFHRIDSTFERRALVSNAVKIKSRAVMFSSSAGDWSRRGSSS